MEKAIVICDNFKLIHIGHSWLLQSVDEMMKKDNINRCYIFIGQEEGDILGQYEKETMLQKLINKDERFLIYHVESLKIFKEIKQINIDGYDIVKVFVEPEEYSFIKNALAGLPTTVTQYKHNISETEIEECIMNGDYQGYCENVPQTLWSEFQNLKELYAKKKISESIKHKGGITMKKTTTKINLKELEKQIESMYEKKQKELNENKKTIKTTKKELYNMIEKIILEKLTGHAFNEMHDLKNDILKQIQKITKHKWIMGVSNIGKKGDGCYIMKLIGSGNTKLNILWGEKIDGDFSFSTSTMLVAGDEFSTSLYSFMNIMTEKKNEIVKIFKDIETKIIPDESGDDVMDEIGDEMSDDMSMGMDNMPMTEPTIDDIDSNISEPMPPAPMSAPMIQPPENNMPDIQSNDIPEEAPDMNMDDGDEEVEISLDNELEEPSDVPPSINPDEEDEEIKPPLV